MKRETTIRSILKALSYRFFGASLTVLIAYVLTGKVGLSAAFGLLDVIVKITAYYFHERVWECIGYGRAKSPDYEI